MSIALDPLAASVKDKNVSDQFFGKLEVGSEHFKLDEDFIRSFDDKKPNFGFNGLGELVYYRTYSRIKPDGSKERFHDTIRRVVEGCYEIQRRHCQRLHIPWDQVRSQRSAQEMFLRIWDFKFTPPGRGLWMMGTQFMWERGSGALNNCFRGDTEIITRDGVKAIGQLVGTTQELLTTGGKWVKAPIKSFGQQELYKLTLERAGVEKVVYTTADHRWFARDRRKAASRLDSLAVADASYRSAGDDVSQDHRYFEAKATGGRTNKYQAFTTKDLRPGVHCLQYVFGQGIQGNVRPSPFGVAHGVAFGDGTTGSDS